MAVRTLRPRVIRAAVRAARGRRTPFYLFDREAAVESLERWRRAAPDSAGLFYPWKCNRHRGLVTLAAGRGFGAEVTSGEDLEAALRLLRAGSRILVQGPAKSRRDIDRAIGAGAWLVADSAEDLRAILGRARSLRIAPRYLIRFRPAAVEAAQRRFGLRLAEVRALCGWIARSGGPLPEGLAFHLGTGLSSPAPYVSAIREAGRLAEALEAGGVPVRVLDVGGGFAARGESRRDAQGRPRGRAATPERFLRDIGNAARRALPQARLFLEPGRAIASDAFHLVARVVRVTNRTVYLDASRVSHAFFVPRGLHPFRPVPRRAGGQRVAIAGPLPVDLDRLADRARVGRPREGDLLIVGSVGAYNLIAGNAWAGSLPQVVEIGVSASGGGRRSGARTRR